MNNSKKNRILKIMITMFLLLGMEIIAGHITKTYAAQSGLDFQIGTVKSKKQVDQKLSYFDLKLNPGEQTDVQVRVVNNTDRVIHVDTSAQPATTSDNGIAVYGKSKSKSDISLPYQIENVATTTTPRLTLQPKSVQVVTYHVTMPQQPLNGLVVAGLSFTEDEKDIKQKLSGNMAIKNIYSYSEALVLHGQTETIQGDLKLKGVDIGQQNARNAFISTLRNPNANFINQLSLSQKIYQRGSKKVLYKTSQKSLQIAPNSIFKWYTRLNGDRFKPGKYTLIIDANSKGRVWHFKKDFDIKNEEAEKYNKKDVSIAPDHTWLYVGIGLLILAILLIIWRIISKRNKKRKEEMNALQMKLESLESDETKEGE